MVSRSMFSFLAAAATIVCAIGPTNSHWSEDDILELVGAAAWETRCLNYVSATVATTGLAMYYMLEDSRLNEIVTKEGGAIQLPGEIRTAHFGNSFDCNVKKTKQECVSSKTRHGIPCGWCDHSSSYGWDPKWEKFFGEGSCYMDTPFTQMGCSLISAAIFEPMVRDLGSHGITPPPVDRQAKCFLLSFDIEKCNQEPDCTSCEIPDVYGLRSNNTPPGKTITVCGVKQLLDGHGAGWCAKMNDVPESSFNFLLERGDDDDVSVRDRMSKKMGKLVFSSKNDIPGDPKDFVPPLGYFVPTVTMPEGLHPTGFVPPFRDIVPTIIPPKDFQPTDFAPYGETVPTVNPTEDWHWTGFVPHRDIVPTVIPPKNFIDPKFLYKVEGKKV